MAKPQQPELRRSGTVPALDPDATESDLEAHKRPGSSGPEGPIPEEQRPGHHPDEEQDKPDLDKFAERMGIVSEEDEPDDAPHVEDDNVTRIDTAKSGRTPAKAAAKQGSKKTPAPERERRSWSPIGLALVGPVTGVLIAKRVLRALRRR